MLVLPSLAKQIGLNEAIFLQQLFFLLNQKRSGVTEYGSKWVYNTIADWQEIFPFWSERTVQRIIKKLQDMQIIEVRESGEVLNRRLFRISDGMEERLGRGEIAGNSDLESTEPTTTCHPTPCQIGIEPPAKLADPLTIYTETSTENKSREIPASQESIPIKKKKEVKIEWPESLKRSDELKAAWLLWVAHRREIKHPLTPLAVKHQIKDLEAMGPVLGVEAINYSIKLGYRAIFPPPQRRSPVDLKEAEIKRANDREKNRYRGL